MARASRMVFIAAFALVLAACSQAVHEPVSQQSPAARPHQHLPPSTVPAAPAPKPSERQPQRPAATIAPSPQASALPPSPGAAQLATQAPTPPTVQRLPAGAPPQILHVDVSRTTVQPGDRVFGRVLTTSNVASVEARIGSYSVRLAKVGVGRFELTYTVGPLPWFVRGHFTMDVIARNARGDAARRAIPLTVR
jgi:hypothetical protein